MIHVEDKCLALPNGRTLAYADNGNTSSSSVVLFLHGAFSVGDASRLPHVLIEKNVHFVAPSLPGWGKSSPVPSPSFYANTFATDITALITHLHPRTSRLKLYICGHSFGTIPAQILYGLSYDTFPLGRKIIALVLLAPLSPPHCHKEYAKSMTWSSYIMAGPLAPYAPFNFVMRLMKLVIATHLCSSDALVEAYARKTLHDTMGEEERERFSRWLDDHGLEEGQFEKEMGRNLSRSVARTWRGFLDIPAIYHSGWGGIHPRRVANKSLVFIVSSKDDHLSPEAMSEWLAKQYSLTTLKSINGSHAAAFFQLNDIWSEIFEILSNPSEPLLIQ